MKVVYSVSENLDPASRCSVEVVNVEIYSLVVAMRHPTILVRGFSQLKNFMNGIFPLKWVDLPTKLEDFPIKMSGFSHEKLQFFLAEHSLMRWINVIRHAAENQLPRWSDQIRRGRSELFSEDSVDWKLENQLFGMSWKLLQSGNAAIKNPWSICSCAAKSELCDQRTRFYSWHFSVWKVEIVAGCMLTHQPDA